MEYIATVEFSETERQLLQSLGPRWRNKVVEHVDGLVKGGINTWENASRLLRVPAMFTRAVPYLHAEQLDLAVTYAILCKTLAIEDGSQGDLDKVQACLTLLERAFAGLTGLQTFIELGK